MAAGEKLPGWRRCDGGWEKADAPPEALLRVFQAECGDYGARVSVGCEAAEFYAQAAQAGFGDNLRAAQEWAERAAETLWRLMPGAVAGSARERAGRGEAGDG